MTYRFTQEELDQQFEQFLKESVSDDSVDLGSSSMRPSVLDHLGKRPQLPIKKSQASVPWWQEQKENDPDEGKESVQLGKTFRKSLRKSQISEEVADEEQCFKIEPRAEAVMLSKDSLEPEDSLIISKHALSLVSQGLHAVSMEDEQRKKTKLSSLSNIDRNGKSVTEHSRQDNDLESYSFREKPAELANEDKSAEDEERLCSVKDNLVSPTYSDDFEDEENMTEPDVKKPERHGMLAKVSLHDSMNSTYAILVPASGSATSKTTELPDSPLAQTAEPSNPGESYVHSGTSEVEDLHEAYRQISHLIGENDEREQGCSRSSLPPPSPECLRKTLHQASTAESDLPTVEELMHAIGPDSDFKFGLCHQTLDSEANTDIKAEKSDLVCQTASAKPENISEVLSELNRNSPKMMESYQSSPSYKHTSITDEIKRLVQEQDKSCSQVPPNVSSKGKKRQVLGKTAVPSVRNKRAEISPVPKVSTTSRNHNFTKSLAQKKSRSPNNRRSTFNETHIIKGPDSNSTVSNDLVASVKSFPEFLQQQMEVNGPSVESPDCSDDNNKQQTNANKESVTETGHNLSPEQSSIEHIYLQLVQKERQLEHREDQLCQEHSKEISALKQENYLLQSKLHSLEEASKKQKWCFGDTPNQITDEKLRLIEKEMKEQETLIQGYHLENEKLYLQMKALQTQAKQNEEAMFGENQKLLTELAFTKEQLNKSSKQARREVSASVAENGSSVSELLAQMQTAQKKEAQLQEENHKLKQEKQALLVDLQTIKKEMNLAKAQVIAVSGDKGFELKLLEERHKEEVAELKKRLQWYAENQELLDRDAARLRAANLETQRLTDQVEKLKMEVTKQANQHEKKVQGRAGQAKRIQDLERQVKELEEILRRRHPNSLPALMFAAAAAGEGKEEEKHLCAASHASHTSALLERRIFRLEAELEGRDEEAKRSLRAMEQHFHRLKLQYEQQISDLEQQLVSRQTVLSKKIGPSHDLQKELENLKEAHNNEVGTLKAEIASLQEQLQQTCLSAEPEKLTRHQKIAEAAQTARVDRLTQELTTKSRTIQELKRTVERLQKETKGAVLSPKVKVSNMPSKRSEIYSLAPAEMFPCSQDEKDYQPKVFSGSHISEVQQENEMLRTKQEQLEQQWQEERVSLQTATSQARSELLRFKAHSAEQLALLKANHQREIENLVTRHALEHSVSKVAEFTNQLKTQEVMVLHLREQLKEFQKTKQALGVSKLREETLQTQVTKLLDELKQAKELHRPEIRHFTSLEHKIHAMECRYNQRELELQQIIAQTRSVVESEQQEEVARWKRLAQGKSSELEAFRMELDSILDILRELQKQGVVIPATQHPSTAAHIFQPIES